METNNVSTTNKLFQEPMALTHFYIRLYPKVQSYILHQKGSVEDAEDIFQEATLLLLEKHNDRSIRTYADTNAYFFGICKNIWHMQLRKRKRIVSDYILDKNYSTTHSELNPIDQHQKDQLFEINFNKLGTTAKCIWNLCFEGNTHAEISTITGWSDAYIRKKKSEGKKSLTQMIRQDPLFTELQDTNPIAWN